MNHDLNLTEEEIREILRKRDYAKMAKIAAAERDARIAACRKHEYECDGVGSQYWILRCSHCGHTYEEPE